MQIDVYTSAQASGKYLVVPTGTDVGNLQLDPEHHEDFAQVHVFKRGLALGPTAIGVAPDDIAAQIAARGYAVAKRFSG